MRILAAVPILLIVAACSSSPPAASPQPTSTTTTTIAAAPVTTVAPVATETTLFVNTSSCPSADPGEVALITAALRDKATRIGEAVKVLAPDVGRVYVGANIYDAAGTRLSSADVWIVEGGKAYALSGSARSLSSLPDGRKLPGSPSAGDDRGTRVQECTRPA